MELTGTTWILAADGAEARIFVEPQRAGAVHELPELHMRAGQEDHAPSHQRATVHERAGVGRHGAGDASPRQEAEDRFLKRVAERLGQAAQNGDYNRLVLMAPPHALGVLRQALPSAAASRIEVSDAHERIRDNAEDIRQHLRNARAKA